LKIIHPLQNSRTKPAFNQQKSTYQLFKHSTNNLTSKTKTSSVQLLETISKVINNDSYKSSTLSKATEVNKDKKNSNKYKKFKLQFKEKFLENSKMKKYQLKLIKSKNNKFNAH
jgi:hypothetical protein